MICLTPFYKKDDDGEYMPLPCGKCPACRSRRASQWSLRLRHELNGKQTAHFVTLTYDTATVPISPHGFMTLDKRDVQLWLKRLRKLCPWQVKYYAVGEYGGEFKRPHYHVILFNATEEAIRSTWNAGGVHIGTVTGASVGYCLKYISKETKVGKFDRDDRVPEFSLMSKGLGKSYLTDDVLRWHKNDIERRVYCVVPSSGGQKVSMPRYYKDKIYSEAERERIARAARDVGDVVAKEIAENPQLYHEQTERVLAAFRRMRAKED